MRVVALGTCASYPGPGNACSGWLVQEEETNLLVDFGTGILAKLQQVLPLPQITAIVISHMHADHFLDLIPLCYAFNYGLAPGSPRPLIFLPPGGIAILEHMAEPLDSRTTSDFFSSVFTTQEYDPGAPLLVGPLTVRFASGNHYVPSWAISVEGGRRVVFTADTGPSDAIARFAHGADLLVTDATYLSVAEERDSTRGHLTATEAGELAALACPKLVLLTHLWPHRDAGVTLRKAKEVFQGDIALAQEGRFYDV